MTQRGSAAKAGGGGGGMFPRIVKASLWALRRARDLYVTGMTRCAGHVGYGGVVGCPAVAGIAVPRSYSFHSASRSSSSGEDDLRELIRAASQGAAGSLNRLGGLGESPAAGGRGNKAGGGAVRRSQSVGMGRIDEDKPCDYFGEDDNAALMAGPLYPRSKSCAVSKRKVGALQ